MGSERPEVGGGIPLSRRRAPRGAMLRPMSKRPHVLVIQAGLGGAEGNTAALVARAEAHLAPHASLELATLAAAPGFAPHRAALARADALIVATGTYWDGPSSHLQRFLEEATPTEGTELWLGKPAAVLVSAHAVGGKSVLARLQSVLVTLGASIPPMSGIVVTLAGQLAIEGAPPEQTADLWSPADLEVVCHNLLVAARADRGAFRAWPVDREDPARRWLR
jgi:NAD(P)H-dependent FMN reductase